MSGEGMAVDLNISFSEFELPTRPASGVWVRELRPSDLALLEGAPKFAKSTNLKRLSNRHHALARALALGETNTAAARLTGYTISRISVLLNDPAFNELVAQYRGQIDTEFADMGVRLAELGNEALSVLHERLEENPEEFAPVALLKIAEVAADRIGFGPHSTQTNVNLNMSARLEAARKRVEEKMIEHAKQESAL